uniref:ABC transporter ATP-binding protein n=1 Tax=Microbacterium flavum TaxID=415216 RepID=UPI0024AE5B62
APARPPGEVLLRARDLAVARVRGVAVASGLDLDVHAGAALAITGPNGAGKSTLALTLAGLLAPAAGEVRAAESLDAGAGEVPLRWRSRDLLTRIGTVFQEPEHQLLRTTVQDELEVGPRALGRSEDVIAARTDELLERLRLAHLARANPYTLSGGEKRRLTVAAALATSPRVLVLDEPTFGQDARTWSELVALLAALRDEGTAILTVTHDDAVVAALHARRFVLGAQAAPAEREDAS